MKIRSLAAGGLLLFSLLLFGALLPVRAAPPPQGVQFATNTPLPDGRILYQVQPGDNCIRIALLHGISVEQLQQLNNLNANCDITQGAMLLVGVGGPASASPTPGPSPTPAPPTPTPTPFSGTTEICVLLFDDMNGDALHQANEPAIEGGAISVAEVNGAYSNTLTTHLDTNPEAYPGVCFTDVPEGRYNIAAAIPDNYNPTMSLTYTLDLRAGDRAFVNFGAQSKEAGMTQPAAENNDTSPLLGIAGGLLILGGLGLGWYALRSRRPPGKFRQGGFSR